MTMTPHRASDGSKHTPVGSMLTVELIERCIRFGLRDATEGNTPYKAAIRGALVSIFDPVLLTQPNENISAQFVEERLEGKSPTYHSYCRIFLRYLHKVKAIDTTIDREVTFRPQVVVRQEEYSTEELGRLMWAAGIMSTKSKTAAKRQAGDVVRFIAHTGLRHTEAGEAEWSWYHPNHRDYGPVLLIPALAKGSKARKWSYACLLSIQAASILDYRFNRRSHLDNKYIFQAWSRPRKPCGQVNDTPFDAIGQRSWGSIKKEVENLMQVPLGTGKWRHLLRHTGKRYLEAEGYDIGVTELFLGHTVDIGDRVSYGNRNGSIPLRREAQQAWSDHLDLCVTGEQQP